MKGRSVRWETIILLKLAVNPKWTRISLKEPWCFVGITRNTDLGLGLQGQGKFIIYCFANSRHISCALNMFVNIPSVYWGVFYWFWKIKRMIKAVFEHFSMYFQFKLDMNKFCPDNLCWNTTEAMQTIYAEIQQTTKHSY